MRPIHRSIAVMVATFAMVLGCTGTRQAYQAAANLEDHAYVLTHHYAALVHEAANLKETGTLPANVVTALQAADRAAKPAVLKLEALARAYEAVQSAENEVALQAAVNEAVKLIAEFARILKSSGGSGAVERIDRDLSRIDWEALAWTR